MDQYVIKYANFDSGWGTFWIFFQISELNLIVSSYHWQTTDQNEFLGKLQFPLVAALRKFIFGLGLS